MAKNEIDLSAYADKAPTDLQSRFADWLMDEDQVGYDPAKAKNKEEAFREGVRLATATRMIFQASPENRKANAERKAERDNDEADEKPAKKSKKTTAAEEPAAKKAKSKKTAEPAEEETPAKKSKSKKGEASGGKVKSGKSKTKAAKVADDEDEAPF